MSKIVKLVGENFKRVKAVCLEVEGQSVIKITGKNRQGKSSIIDMIWWVLSNPGKKVFPEPIRMGEKKAVGEIVLDNGITCKRVATDKTDRLEVVSAEGATFASPQAMLDKWLGYALDPKDFMALGEKEQVRRLLVAFGLGDEMARLDGEYRILFDERTFQNRQIKSLEAQVGAGMIASTRNVKRVDVSLLENKISEVSGRNNKIISAQNETALLQKNIDAASEEMIRLAEKIEQWQKSIDALAATAKEEPADMASLMQEVSHAREQNALADKAEAQTELVRKLTTSKENSAIMSEQLEGILSEKKELVKAIDFPFAGMAVDDELGITLNGVPIRQASDSEQLCMCLAIAAHTIPDEGIRVIRVSNGSLLDDDSLRVLNGVAESLNVQIWIEMVAEEGLTGFVIEDGQVKEVK